MSTRRDVLKAAALAPAAAVAQPHQHAGLVQVARPYKPRVFSSEELAFLGKLADAIIPRSDTPGASDAGVPLFIDRRAGARAAELRAGMSALDALSKQKFARNFAALTDAQTVELLTPIADDASTAAGAFFVAIKNYTVDGYYTSKEGLAHELGWNANTYLPEFKGCTHEEHK